MPAGVRPGGAPRGHWAGPPKKRGDHRWKHASSGTCLHSLSWRFLSRPAPRIRLPRLPSHLNPRQALSPPIHLGPPMCPLRPLHPLPLFHLRRLRHRSRTSSSQTPVPSSAHGRHPFRTSFATTPTAHTTKPTPSGISKQPHSQSVPMSSATDSFAFERRRSTGCHRAAARSAGTSFAFSTVAGCKSSSSKTPVRHERATRSESMRGSPSQAQPSTESAPPTTRASRPALPGQLGALGEP